MKKSVLILTLTLATYLQAFAIDISQRLLSLVQLKPQQATAQQITSLLGNPTEKEETGRMHTWYYKTNTATLTLYWNSKTSSLEKYSFETVITKKVVWDDTKARLLKTGETELAQVIKLLGTPQDMTIKQMNQQMRYAFQDVGLNLFFHKGTLVNYTLF